MIFTVHIMGIAGCPGLLQSWKRGKYMSLTRENTGSKESLWKSEIRLSERICRTLICSGWGTPTIWYPLPCFTLPERRILRSKDLCHWEIVSYVFETLEDNGIYRLENGRNAYGKGQWATSLTRHNGRFYACFVSHDCGKTYIFSTDDIEKSGWDRAEIGEVFHDMSFLFWEGIPYWCMGTEKSASWSWSRI